MTGREQGLVASQAATPSIDMGCCSAGKWPRHRAASSLQRAAFRCFHKCQQQRRTNAGAVPAAIEGGACRRWRLRTWAWGGMVTPTVAQKRAATGQCSAMWLAVSSGSSQSGQPVPATSTMVLRRRTPRVWTRDKVSSHPKNFTRDGAWLSQMILALVEATTPKLHNL